MPGDAGLKLGGGEHEALEFLSESSLALRLNIPVISDIETHSAPLFQVR
jgi:hypothetical protein